MLDCRMLRAACCVFFMAGSAGASTLTEQFSSFWVLGDSLSAYAGETGGEDTVRASDGPLWSEQIISEFDTANREAQSFARGGATAGLSRDTVVDLAGQTEELVAQQDRFGDNPLVAIWIGGNDIRAFQTGLAPTTSQTVFRNTLEALIAHDVKNFLLFEVPDVGYTPLVRSGPDGAPTPETLVASALASGASASLNGLFFDGLATPEGFFIEGVVQGLDAGIHTTVIDAFDLTRLAYDVPDFFGADTRGPCEGSEALNCEMTTFWDPFHPTARLHDYIADEVRAAYATPVPLPAAGWLLVAAVGGLVVMRRRA